VSLKVKICIVDYGVGNTQSVSNALSFLGYTKVKISDKEADIIESDVVLLPGVGAFDEAVKNLNLRNLDKILSEDVLVRKKPILGICVGMQMLATLSEENGIHSGFNWIEGRVRKLELPIEFPVPQVGWNDVNFALVDPLFSKFNRPTNFILTIVTILNVIQNLFRLGAITVYTLQPQFKKITFLASSSILKKAKLVV
jgi:glutamine amidotransferase